MAITGSDFEKLVEPFFRNIFEKMGFCVLQVRRQGAGNQDGFDISVAFIDESGIERIIFIECKYYTSAKLEWSDILNKQMQLNASSYSPTAFILLSPLKNLSNIDNNIQAKVCELFKFPADFWTPDKDVEKLFALDIEIYKKVYDKPNCDIVIEEDREIEKIKTKINLLISRKIALKYIDTVRIAETLKDPIEDSVLKTTLDEKLNSVLPDGDSRRIDYHRIRANYKVYVEELADVNTELRNNILSWQNDMRLKANRLTHKFKIDENYTPEKFFLDFFDIAEKDIEIFFSGFNLRGDKQKLLHGIVFELAAECPLDWRRDER